MNKLDEIKEYINEHKKTQSHHNKNKDIKQKA
jgi:hypothetical protein